VLENLLQLLNLKTRRNAEHPVSIEAAVSTQYMAKNLFSAELKGTKAMVNNMEIELGRDFVNADGYIVIRPKDIVIRRQELSSSMRNSFQGTAIILFEKGFYYEAQYSACGTSRFIGALSPVNASPVLSPLPMHDSGLMWMARPSP